jgi:Nucleotidyl transferase AbiEii toxin, Type IV TA system
VLEELMQIKQLDDFILVGGTSLALRYGHRDSEDIDLFTSREALPANLWNNLKSNKRILQYAGDATITFIDEGIKVDLARWNIDFQHFETIEGIRMAHPLDVFAMKFDAIQTRKTKKDFIDIYELCQHFSFHQGFAHFHKLFPYSKNSSIIYAAFGEIDKADKTKQPTLFKDYEWDFVKDKLRTYAKRYFFNIQ